MTQFPSIFNSLLEPNQPNLQQTSNSQQNYGQSMQTKPTGLYSQTTTNGQQRPPFDFPIGNPSPSINQQQQQQMLMNAIAAAAVAAAGSNSFVPPSPLYCNNWCGVGGHVLQPVIPQSPTSPSGCTACLPQAISEQIRNIASHGSPIFILPNAQPNVTGPVSTTTVPTCVPFPVPLALYPPCGSKPKETECCTCLANKPRSPFVDPCDRWMKEGNDGSRSRTDENNCGYWSEHQCKGIPDGAVCSMKNCPASIQLQAMVSQLLGIQGIVPSAITRMLLKRIPGSNVTDTMEETMERAMRCLRQLAKDQLLRESKSSQDVNRLLGLYLTSSSTLPRIIPILTSAQLKSNVLKALVENLINAKLMEDQGYGAEAPDALDPLLLELKSNDDLRQLLASLRERECEERVNLTFAACGSQRLIAESRLGNIQRKISQVEKEMDRRRDHGNDQEPRMKRARIDLSMFDCNPLSQISSFSLPERYYESPDPFMDIRVRSPKKLLLKSHVGSPETTYVKPSDTQRSSFCKVQVQSDESCSFVCVNQCTQATMCHIIETGKCSTIKEPKVESLSRTISLTKKSTANTDQPDTVESDPKASLEAEKEVKSLTEENTSASENKIVTYYYQDENVEN